MSTSYAPFPQGGGYAQQNHTIAGRRASILAADPSYFRRLYIRIGMFLLGIVPIGIFAYALGTGILLGGGYWFIFLAEIVLFKYALVSTIIACVRRSPSHPGFRLAAEIVQLLLWIIATGTSIACGIAVKNGNTVVTVTDSEGFSEDVDTNVSDLSDSQISAVGSAMIGGGVVCVVVFLLQCYLFVTACRDVHRYRKRGGYTKSGLDENHIAMDQSHFANPAAPMPHPPSYNNGGNAQQPAYMSYYGKNANMQATETAYEPFRGQQPATAPAYAHYDAGDVGMQGTRPQYS